MKSNAVNGSGPRARVAQAQGMVSVQADCTLDAALALLRNTARATDETLEYIAGEVVHRHVRFE
jgi:AmiR/NasT family two-component response regulator